VGPVFDALRISAGQAPDDRAIANNVVEATEDLIRFQMWAPELFGGDRREGGIAGEGILYRGSSTQESDAYLSSKITANFPAYQRLCYAVLKGCYLGNSNYLRNLNFIVKRFPSNLGLPASVTRIYADANPAEIIYEAMTDTFWGLGRPPARFDLVSWQGAAITLAAEHMGMSLLWDKGGEARELIEDILRHIDGVVQTDPQTGLWSLRLIRAQAPELTLSEEDQIEAPEFTRGSWEETWNDIKVRFIHGATFKPAEVQAQESANESILASTVTQIIDFLGFSQPLLAQQVAMRELKAHSYPFAKVRIRTKRKAWPLRVGSPFEFSWAPAGISSMILRVLTIDYGRLGSGMIEIDAIEDAFAVAYSAFDVPAESEWDDPVLDIGDASPPEAQLLFEAPLEFLDSSLPIERILAGMVRSDENSTAYEIWADEGDGWFEANVSTEFIPSGLLMAPYSRMTEALDLEGFTLDNATDLATVTGTDEAGRIAGKCLLLFEDTQEICAFETIVNNGDGTFTLGNIVRAVFDTLPADHPAGTRVFILRAPDIWYVTNYESDPREVPVVISGTRTGRVRTTDSFQMGAGS